MRSNRKLYVADLPVGDCFAPRNEAFQNLQICTSAHLKSSYTLTLYHPLYLVQFHERFYRC